MRFIIRTPNLNYGFFLGAIILAVSLFLMASSAFADCRGCWEGYRVLDQTEAHCFGDCGGSYSGTHTCGDHELDGGPCHEETWDDFCGDWHSSCTWVFLGPGGVVDQLVAALDADALSQLRDLAFRYQENITYVQKTASLRITGCEGKLLARIPTPTVHGAFFRRIP